MTVMYIGQHFRVSVYRTGLRMCRPETVAIYVPVNPKLGLCQPFNDGSLSSVSTVHQAYACIRCSMIFCSSARIEELGPLYVNGDFAHAVGPYTCMQTAINKGYRRWHCGQHEIDFGIWFGSAMTKGRHNKKIDCMAL